MFEVLAFVWVVAAFAAFYFLLPAWAGGAGARRPLAGWASIFVRFSFFVEIAVVLLGIVGLALPGALLAICFLWLAIDFAQREPELFGGGELRRAWLIRRLLRLRSARRMSFAQVTATWRNCSSLWFIPAAALAIKALFPVYNARFTHVDDYSRSISLAVLSNGHHWIPDLSVPLLLPLQYLASVSAPRAVALSEPLFAAILIAAVGFAVVQLTRCRVAGATAMSVAVMLTLSPLMDGAAELSRAEFGATFVILAIGFQSTSRFDALLSAALGFAAGFTPDHFASSFHILIPYASCVLLGVGIAEFRIRLSALSQRLASAVLIACLFGAGLAFPRTSKPDGPIQYEEAARIALRLADEQPRNAWALVSTTQELPYVYGSGWHVEIANFVNGADITQVARSSYRFPFPVRDVYFLVESQPLIPYGSLSDSQSRMQVRLSPTPSAAYGTPLERASLEFRLAELLSAYRRHHGDLETVHQSANLVVFRAPGSLRDER